MNTINLERDTQILKMVHRAKIDYIEELTGNTRTIIVPKMKTKYLISDSFLSFKDLGFISQVKSFSNSTGIEKQPFDSGDINYFKMNHEHRDGLFYDVCEIDVNGAYWEIAKRKGYISEKIYKKGLTVDKKTRLIALGALATVKRRFEFSYNSETGKYDENRLEDKKNEITRSYFFDVAKELDIIMNEFCEINGMNGIYLFWVDAFFVDNYRAKEMVDFFAKKGLKVKRKKIPVIRCLTGKNSKKVWATEIVREEKEFTTFKIKPFFEGSEGYSRKRAIRNFRETVLKFNNEKQAQ